MYIHAPNRIVLKGGCILLVFFLAGQAARNLSLEQQGGAFQRWANETPQHDTKPPKSHTELYHNNTRLLMKQA